MRFSHIPCSILYTFSIEKEGLNPIGHQESIMSCGSSRNSLQAKINRSMADLIVDILQGCSMSADMCSLTLPSKEVPATCPVAMVILSGWTARLQEARGRPKGQ